MRAVFLLIFIPYLVLAQKVGINEITPKSSLDVKGTTTSDSIVIDQNSLISRANTNLKPLTISNDGNIVIKSKISDTGFAAQRIFFGNESVNYVEFNGQSKRVGVDVLNPQEKLDVAGGVRLSDAENSNAGTIQFNSGNQTFEGHDGNGWVALSDKQGYKYSRMYRSNQSGVIFDLVAFGVTGKDVLIELWGYGGDGNAFCKCGGQAGGYVLATVDIEGLTQLTIDLLNTSTAIGRVEVTFMFNGNNYTLGVGNGEDANTGRPGWQGGDPVVLQTGTKKIALKKFMMGEPGNLPDVSISEYTTGNNYLQKIIAGDGGSAYGHRNGGRGGIYINHIGEPREFFRRQPTPGLFPGGGGGGGGNLFNSSENALGGNGAIVIHYN